MPKKSKFAPLTEKELLEKIEAMEALGKTGHMTVPDAEQLLRYRKDLHTIQAALAPSVRDILNKNIKPARWGNRKNRNEAPVQVGSLSSCTTN